MEKAFKTIPAKNVDEYLEALPETVCTALEKLRKAIKTAAPDAEEIISYQIPTYKYKGALVHFAAFANHCSFFGVSKNMLKIFAKELQPYKTSGTTIRFTADKPLPAALVKKMVRARIGENEERNAADKRANAQR